MLSVYLLTVDSFIVLLFFVVFCLVFFLFVGICSLFCSGSSVVSVVFRIAAISLAFSRFAFFLCMRWVFAALSIALKAFAIDCSSFFVFAIFIIVLIRVRFALFAAVRFLSCLIFFIAFLSSGI